MHRLVIASFACLLLACASLHAAQRASADAADTVVPPPVDARAVEAAVERIAAARASLWPGFDPRTIPLAVFDGRRTWLFRHPSPPQGFVAQPGVPGAMAMDGRLAAIVANTSADIGGVPTGTLVLDPGAKRGVDAWAAIAIHEAFHVFQRAHHTGWAGNEADLFTYPVDDAGLLALRRLETRALDDALAASDRVRASCRAHAALALRAQRYAAMEAAYAAYERGTELNEGLATYVQHRAEGGPPPRAPAGEFGPAQVRQRAYATGLTLALLLDRYAPGWPAAFEADDTQTLDGALAKALGEGQACSDDAAALDRAQAVARSDVAALLQARKDQLAAFEARPGWRIVVETDDANPLWPQGFDPLNVDRVAPARILHTRFVKLGNDAGHVEVLGAQALSDGIGPHPLFQGVRRVLVAGLAGKPTVSTIDGVPTVKADGVDVAFKGARVSTTGQTIVVRLAAPVR